MDFLATASKIESLVLPKNRTGDKLQETLSDPWVRDALSGTMWLEKYRGTLTEYLNEKKSGFEILQSTADRLRFVHKYQPNEPNWPGDPPLALVGIGIGTYGWKYNLEIIQRAVNLGAQVIDTAEGYGFGKVEEALGKIPTTEGLIASKFSRTHCRRDNVIAACKRSLGRLNRTKIDIYQLHWPVWGYLTDSIVGLIALKKSGLIGEIGVCNCSIDLLHFIQATLAPAGLHIATLQTRYNYGDREAENVLIPYCRKRGIRVIAYSPLAQGKFRNNGIPARAWIQWLVNLGVVPIPRTNNLDHLREIFACMT